ncbi:MAG: right-handed parallel beta-helix repeat-containing protein, partial [Candidatus Aenigmatarchaeota archaeon]
YSWGVNITAPENMTLQNVTVKNCIIQKGSSSGSNGYGIRMRGVANSTLLNNTIRTNGTSDNYGIALEGAADNAIEGNSISTDGASQNHGIMLSPGNGTIELVSYTISPNYPTCNPEPNVDTCNVCFTTGGVTCASTGWKNDYEFECSPAHGCGKHRDFACAKGEGFKTETLLNFTLSTAVTGGRIIVIGGEDVYCQLNGNTILSFYAKNKCGALHQTSIPASAFTTGLNNLTCSVAGSGETEANGFKLSYFSYDLPIANESIRNRIEGNTIAVAGNDSHGILLKENSNLNTLASNNITAGGNRSDAVHVRDASGNVFENNTLSYARSGVRVVRSLASIFRNSSLTGSSPLFIDELEGYIEYTEPLSIATETNLSAVVSIARNATRVNSSHAAGSQLNKSAQLTFFNLPFLGSSPVVDFNDTGSFDACPQPQCKEVNDTYGTYIYNVSSFTTYAAKEETVCQVIDEPQEFEVLNDVIASGACFVIDSDDVTLDCNGYSIIGNGSGVGVIAFEATNITVKDCHISNFTIGVAFDTVSLSLISNVIIDRVASGVDFINVSGTSVRGVSVSNETYNATAGEFGIGMRFENSTWNVVDGFTVRFNASGNISYGMMLIDGMNANNTLANMSLESMATAGVYIKNGTGNTVIYSNISTPAIAGYGVLLALGASSNDMLWSNISTLYAGVHISFASNGNNISHNRISTLGPDPLPAVTIHDSSGETVAWNIIAANLSNSSYAAIQMTNATSSTVARNNVTAATGVALSMTNASNSNVIEHNRFTDSRIGIYLDASSSNSFANNTVYGNAEWDFYSWSGSLGNLVANLTSWQNVVSFESKDVALKGLLPSQAPANPIGKLNISRWVNATNNSADSWLFLNLSYSDEDVAGVRESTLKVWKHNASGWTSEAFWSVSDVSAGDNIVYANITDFGSTFGVFGDHLLSACGDLDTPNATYIMNQSIYVNGTCMNITADNVTLDCDGHSIVGNGSGYGIYAANRSHITAKRCVIANFTDALMLWNVSQGMFESNIVANNTAPYPAGRAFRVYFGSANSFVNNTVYNSRYPFQITTSTYNVIANNSASGNLGPGVWIDWQSNYNNITSNIFTSNGEDGIAIYHSYHNIIINNTAASNSRYGISFTSGSAHNTVINNTAQNNAVWDFFSSSNALNNTVINLITWQNRISFIALDICLRGMLPTEAPADPSGATNISKWVNATNNSADSWLFLNFSYSDGELGGANESKLRIAKHNASGWTASGFYQAGQWGVDEAANVAYANITNFESTFAPLADEQAPNTTTLYPANLSWQRAAFNVSISDYDNLALDESACYWRILDNGTQSWPTAGIAVPGKPGTWDTRTCSANVTVTVGPSSNCSTEGWAMCSVESFAIDLVGNVG